MSITAWAVLGTLFGLVFVVLGILYAELTGLTDIAIDALATCIYELK